MGKLSILKGIMLFERAGTRLHSLTRAASKRLMSAFEKGSTFAAVYKIVING
jgi:dTDP-glucose pyrophosphorylase